MSLASSPLFHEFQKQLQEENQRVFDGQHKMDNSDDVSAKLGVGMLNGWCLLGEHCPICVTPLMRKKDGTMYCVKCEMQVVREEDFNAQTQTRMNQEEQAPSAAAAAAADGDDDGVGEGAHDTAYADQDDLPLDDFVEVGSELLSTGQSRTNEVSATLGQYLLQGWTMLGVHCQDCNCPLMSKGGQRMCVACGESKSTGDQDDSAPVVCSSSSFSSSSSSSASCSSTGASIFSTNTKFSEVEEEEEEEEEEAVEVKRVVQRVSQSTYTPQDFGTSGQEEQNIACAVNNARLALVNKLQLCTTSLESSQDPSRITLVAQSMESVVSALNAIQNYRQHVL
jgi:uncharacterized Zn finger protein (UPF0148 family)